MAVKAKEDENVVFSWIIWPSKEARDAGNKAAMADPRLANLGPDSMPFDGKRMFYGGFVPRSEEHTSELQSLMRISYAVFCLKKKQQLYIHKVKTRHTTQKHREE